MARGVPRAPGMTPYEYLRALERGLSLYSAPLSVITRAYVQARYSITSIDAAHAQEVQRVWQQITHIAERGNGNDKH